MRRRTTTLFAAALMLVATACGGSGGGTAHINIVEQDYYGAPTPDTTAPQYLASFFKKYSKEHPNVSIKRESPVSPNYSSLVLSQIASGAQPDLLMVDNPDLDRLASAGVLVPLNQLGKIDTSGINANNIQETTYNGKLYALPLYTNTIAIFYNKDLLRKAGITKLPTTWDEFRADAKKTATKNTYGFVFSGQTGPGESTWQFEPWLWSNGGDLTTINSPQSVQALNYWASLVKSGASPKDVVNWSQTQPIQEFEAGKAAFCENGLWNIPSMKSQFKKLHWGVMQIPTRVTGQPVVPPLGGEVWTIPKTTPERERAAFNVLKEMAQPSNVLPLAKGLSDVPTRTSLWNQSTWSGPEYKAFFQELKHGRSRTRDLTADYPQVETIIGNATASALIGKTSAKDAFDSAKHDIEKVLHS
jgi:multiple sugar transport system substrate-binding protein